MENTPNQSASDSVQPMSRRERRELKRQGQQGMQKASGRRRLLRRIGIWAIGCVVLVGLGWLMMKAASRVPVATDGSLAVPVSASDNSFGPASASVTLVEYSDFQCPACAAFAPVLKQLFQEPELEGKIRLVYRHFPLTNIHKNAELAARAAQAAAVQGKFWEMHDLLFTNQTKWSVLSSEGARGAFTTYAKDLGMDADQFSRDLDSDSVKDRVTADSDGGLASGVNSTPSFFLNGSRMSQPASYDAFKQAIITAADATP